VVGESSIPEQPRQHGERARRESLIDEWLLQFECFDGGAAWEWVFARIGIDNLGKQFAVPRVQWLAENELTAGVVVAKIEPAARSVPCFRQCPLNPLACFACIDTTDDEIWRVVDGSTQRAFIEERGFRRPLRTPEQVDAIDQDHCLVLAYVGGGKWLPDTVRLRNRIGIHHDYVQSVGVPPNPHGLVKIRQAHHDRAAGPPAPMTRTRTGFGRNRSAGSVCSMRMLHPLSAHELREYLGQENEGYEC
jgi:hypothetical protein